MLNVCDGSGGGWGWGWVTILIIMPLCGPILQVKTFSKIFNYKLKFSDRAECGKNAVECKITKNVILNLSRANQFTTKLSLNGANLEVVKKLRYWEL